MPWLVGNTLTSCFEGWQFYSGDNVSADQPLGNYGLPWKWRYLIEPWLREFVTKPPYYELDRPIYDYFLGLSEGERTTDIAPVTMVLPRRHKKLLDNIETYTSEDFTVSDRVKQIIESIEPDRHHFLKVNMLAHDLTLRPELYWAFKAGESAVFQAMIVEQSERLHWVPYEGRSMESYKYWMRFDTGRTRESLTGVINQAVDVAAGITVDKAAFDRRHIVKEEVYRREKTLIFSDVLVTALKREKVTGFTFGKVKMIKRLVPPYGVSNGRGAVA